MVEEQRLGEWIRCALLALPCHQAAWPWPCPPHVSPLGATPAGTLPAGLGGLHALEVLQLGGNALEGSLDAFAQVGPAASALFCCGRISRAASVRKRRAKGRRHACILQICNTARL
jgi:hypothetical protein